MEIHPVLLGLTIILLLGCKSTTESARPEEWISLFNGHDLTGWTPKFSDHLLGTNYKNTFTVKDSAIQANYAEYDTFRNEFGHLFYKNPFTFYRLKMEYRFVGPSTPGAPAWAQHNSGVMIVAQSPESMKLEQDFPLSLEVQFLGGDGTTERPTGNVCTPGLHIYMNDTLVTQHCSSSTSKTYHGDQWVKMEVVVLPDSTVHHLIEGDTVMSYRYPTVGGDFLPEGYPVKEGTKVIQGYMALQAESHHTEFRRIMLQEIKKSGDQVIGNR